MPGNQRTALKIILLAGLIAGAADALAAILFYTQSVNAENIGRVFRTIACGLFGKSAYSGSAIYPIAGLLLHFLMAMIWAAVYYFISRRFLPKGRLLLKCVGTGSVVWLVMNLVVLPLSRVPEMHHTGSSAIKGILILIFTIGLPFALLIGPGGGKTQMQAD